MRVIPRAKHINTTAPIPIIRFMFAGDPFFKNFIFDLVWSHESKKYLKGKKLPNNRGIFMESKRFSKNDNGFVCQNCKKEVLPLGYTSRNHCPFCLCSLHVDINPGDRENPCCGILRPISALPDAKRGYIIIHRCDKCGATVRNKAAHEAKVQPDDLDLIIKLTAMH